MGPRNLQLADELADGDVDLFLACWQFLVVQPARADPTIVRKAYWKCYRP